jgi:hypothetical protein
MGNRWVWALVSAVLAGPAGPAPVPVRWAEGTLHGFLELRSHTGQLLAHGDLLQIPRDSDIESHLVFHFTDSSEFSETVMFTQHHEFRLETYRLLQRGKAFAADLDVTLSRTGEYRVTSTSHKDGKGKTYSGKLDLPADTYNGMIPVIGKNVDRKIGRTVHVVAFTPKPLVIPLQMVPSEASAGVIRFTLKPKLNAGQRLGAKLTKRTPPDSHLWIVTDGVPAFVRFEGPLYQGPIWRVDQTGPRWPGDRARTTASR